MHRVLEASLQYAFVKCFLRLCLPGYKFSLYCLSYKSGKAKTRTKRNGEKDSNDIAKQEARIMH